MKKVVALSMMMQFGFGLAQAQFDLAGVEKFQKELNAEYADAKTSPLLPEDLISFQTLDFYPANAQFFVVAKFIRSENEQPFEMKTTTARKPVYVKYGEAHFSIDGQDFKLNVYSNIELSKKKEYKDYLFLPFSDLTCGNERYIGGRYLDLEIPQDDNTVVAYNR